MVKMKKIPKIQLIPIDLNKADIRKEGNNHPDIRENILYLAKISGKWYLDSFSLEWYGWNFNGVYDAGYQLTYGHNPYEDGWQELYEILINGKNLK